EDAAEVELAGELFPAVVEAPSETHASMVWIDGDVDAVEAVAFRVVIANVAAVARGGEGVPLADVLRVDDEARRRRDELSFVLDADLPLRKVSDLAFELVARPRLDARKALSVERDDGLPIVDAERPDDDLRLLPRPSPVLRHGLALAPLLAFHPDVRLAREGYQRGAASARQPNAAARVSSDRERGQRCLL